ncbi:MAG: tetratricopeptide repeat protein [Nitrospira sp.]|nr:tetratricopeptide repeat protein [Nitrospira sp.]
MAKRLSVHEAVSLSRRLVLSMSRDADNPLEKASFFIPAVYLNSFDVRISDEIKAKPFETKLPEWVEKIPYPTENFVGREKDIIKVERLFSRQRVITIKGAYSIGKSTLAKKIARDNIWRFPDGIFWFTSKDNPLLNATRIEREIVKFLDEDSEIETAIRDRKLLLIIDNWETIGRREGADKQEIKEEKKRFYTLIEKFSRYCNVIITSRDDTGYSSDVIVPIYELPVKRSVELFRRIVESFDKPLSKNLNDEVIKDICDSSGNSPLAVMIIANQLRTESIEDVIEKLEEEKIEELYAEIKGEEHNIVKAIKLSFDTLKENEKLLLIRLPALVGVINEKTVQALDVMDVKRSLGLLFQKSLVERIGNRYFLQTLTNMFAKKELKKKEGEDALFSLKLKTLNWAEKNNDDLLIELTAGVFERLHTIGKWDDCLRFGHAALKAIENKIKSGEIGHEWHIAFYLHNLGIVHQLKGDYDKALEFYQKSLEIKEKIGDIAGAASSMGMIGNIMYIKKDYKTALRNYLISLDIFEKIGSPNADIVKGFISELIKKIGEEEFNKLLTEIRQKRK